ncbi:adenosine deaminase [Brachybacterium endophyticum]|uniref:adenosine deaminase n=2 Tax=Brachybacterium endophyticum TaxID=2182385 RepID=A0A2U2RMG0_9MICO|nr:adenosine deaminase [Brachybacterium endophyticum]PWH06985.1 adenosine deaminase [Brachybacterium endophyticum]
MTPDAPLGTALSPSGSDGPALPLVVLHDHLDGGVRASTVLELSREFGIELPEGTVEGLADWFFEAADSGSLPRYLGTFARTLAVMQTARALRRIAREFVEDMVADGVCYAETRWAPEQHTEGGLSMAEAVAAVREGLEEGVAAAAAAGQRIVVGQILCIMRQNDPRVAADHVVDLAIAGRGEGVVGVDLAGPEDGFLASRFRDALERAHDAGVHVTIHAGEAAGIDSIADALDCGAERLGHGVRLVDDLSDSGPGPTARRVRDQRVLLEVCPSSNLQTGAFADMSSHPVEALRRAGMRVAVSSDNRLMSRTSTSRELRRIIDVHGWSLAELERAALEGLDAGFAPDQQRHALREDVVVPAYRAARAAAER